MDAKTKRILRVVQMERPRSRVVPPESWPNWLKTSPWSPSFILSEEGRFLAVAVEWSGTVPRSIYRIVVGRLLKEHTDLSVMVCIPANRVGQDLGLATFCRKIKVILRAAIPSVGTEEISEPVCSLLPLKTLVRSRPSAKRQARDEHFPGPILYRVRNLQHLFFSQILTLFSKKVSRCTGDDKKTLALVKHTIDKLLRSHPFLRVTSAPFMRLKNFEHLLTRVGGDTSDHVLHSFRVFLAGCPVIDRFYDQIQSAQRRIAICYDRDLHVEYSWLLASLFHDTGRVREGMRQLVDQISGDDYNEVRGSPARWSHPGYQMALRMLGSLGAYIAGGENGGWDGGSLEDERGNELSGEWIELYNSYSRHGVNSAFDLLADILGKMTAAGERKYRRFIVSHAVPAALAMLLHEWQLWEAARAWGLFPVNVKKNPLAALLLYIDTWDDIKRRRNSPPITISDYVVDDTGATVFVEWPNKELLEKKMPEYLSFSNALTDSPPFFIITPYVKPQ